MGIMELILLTAVIVVPLFLIALVDILKSDFKGNDKIVWMLVVILLPLLGSLLYFVVGRKQKLTNTQWDEKP